ncbi:carbohydrate ABC transporter permease [Anaerocolumna sp. MB42-C2]|uniref:carbohydrate ABC transporter permease n=1 Tax=Anaerocolumna sp. MB42-C2 TaxID=3070997 RepID=UPI0027E0B203|nr:sugar ABC transporter permease [Anaerocolumna sp. MB42-C2]WMJ85853.1 sugar ABC transporter permease [Anaerocolumna sp. MB42-C2]
MQTKKLALSKIKHLLYNKKAAPYIFCMPFVLSFFIFFLYPIVTTFYMSFMDVIGLDHMNFVGLKNYKRLSNEHFFNAIKTSTIYTLSMITIMMILPITIAALLNSRLMKLKNLFRAFVFLPSLTSVIVAGIAFRLIFGDTELGFVNSILLKLGREIVPFKLGYGTGILIMVVLASWREIGINMVYCLSALQSVPEDLIESAQIDGAGTFKRFWYVTLPQVKPIIIYILTLTIINGYRMFTEGYVYWNETNPGDNGLTIVRYIYQQAFQRNDFGMGSAIGVVLLAIILIINMGQLKFFGLFRKEDQE